MVKTNHANSSIQLLGVGGRNVYSKTEMLTATITDDTDKHQPSLPAPCNTFLLQKLTVKTSPIFYGAQSLITVLIAVISMH
jgi:hypothetical protein